MGKIISGIVVVVVAIVVISIAVSAGGDSAAPADGQAEPIESVLDEVFDDTEFVGTFVDAGPFNVAGEVTISGGDLGQRTLRLSDDFSTTRALEKSLYLRAEDRDFVVLGPVELSTGEQFFDVPAGLDLTVYNEVQIWDEQLNVALGTATISPDTDGE